MEAGRFFYSTNGTDVQGPVTWGVLHQLFQDQVIGSGSFLCREGETEWQPLNPGAFQTVIAQATVVVPPARATPPPFVPPVQYVQARPGQGDSPEEHGLAKIVVGGLGWIAAIGGAVVTSAMTQPPAAITNIPAYKIGAFAGGLVFFALLPYLISLIFKGLTRTIVGAVGMIGLSVLSVIGQMNLSTARALAAANALSDKTKDEAKKEIAAKGYYTGDPQKADQDIQQIQNQLTGNSETARLSRDLLDVSHQMIAKVKVSTDAENACIFEVKTIASQDDIASRRALLGKLKDTQTDVKTFLENYDSHCREAMARENAAPATVDAFVGGAHKGAHIDLLVNLWQEKIKLTDDYVARLDFLSQKFGAWSAKDGKILFQDDAAVADYNKLVGNLHDDVVRIEAIQKQFFQ